MTMDFSPLEALENANDIIIVTRANPVDEPGPEIVYVNKAFTRLTGYAPEEVIGKTPRILQGPNTREETRAQIRQALLDGKPIRTEIVNYSKSGEEYWLDINIVPIRDSGGKVSHFVAIERDLSESKKTQQELEQSRNRYQSIFASMAEGVVMQDASGFIISHNENAERILGLTSDQLSGRTSIDPRWRAIRPDGTPFPGEEHPAMVTLRGGEPCKDVIMGVHKPDDSLTWISINSQPMFNPREQTPYAVVATFHDITEKRIAEQLKSEFISTVSHELRTPLTSIRGSIGLLAGGAVMDVPPKARDLLDIALSNCDRLMFLINDLLDMEKIASGKMEFVFDKTSLDETIETAIRTNQPYADKHRVTYKFARPLAPVTAEADKDRILQVFANFLSNAAKFSPENSVVEIGLEDQGDFIHAWVADHGPGIPESFRHRVFDKFAQADGSDTRNRGGTGLGLAISKAIIERHNGKIGFRENAPGGTIFYFVIPKKQTQ